MFLLVNKPKHNHSKKWSEPFHIVKRINDHNYIVDINGENTITNISKMKLYNVNKYSNLPGQKRADNASKNSAELCPKRTDSTKNVAHDSDSDSDEEFIISFPTSGSNNLDNNANSQQRSDSRNSSVSYTADETRNSSTEGSRSSYQSPVSLRKTSPGNSSVSSPLTANRDNNTTPRTPTVLSDDMSDDNGQDRFHNSESSPITGHDTAVESVRPNNSGESDISSRITSRKLILPDIERHGLSRGIDMQNMAGPSREISRSTGVTNLSDMSSTKYNLRPKPSGVQKYGVSSPVKSLKKKLSKTKNTSKTKK